MHLPLSGRRGTSPGCPAALSGGTVRTGRLARLVGVFFVLAIAARVLGAQWTVAVYMCADNGLNDQAYVDIGEMMSVGSTDEVNIVIQVDNAARDTHPDCRRYRVVKGGLEPLGELGEVDMADTAVLGEFARFVKQNYPARNYFFILWDHGDGWTEGYGPARSIFIDESHSHSMGVAGGELAAALAAVRQALGVRVKVLGFDACLMGMVEVACEVQDACDYLLASEGLVPWGGWPYQDVLALLAARPTDTPAEFLPGMCDAYLAEYPNDNICLSAVDMRQLDRVLPVARATLKDSLDPTNPAFVQAREAVQTFPSISGRPPCASDDQVDLIHYWELAPEAGTGALRSMFVPLPTANRTSGDYAEARGIAVWFPDNYLVLKAQAGSYRKLAFADSVPWLEFLNRYFGSDDVRPTQPAISDIRLGGRGDLRFWWSRSCDLAPVTYDLHEVSSPSEVLVDCGDSLGNWSAVGWTTSEWHVHSRTRAFFSGSASNLDNQLVLVRPLKLEQGGLLSCYVYYSTEEILDSAGGFKRDVCYVEWSEDKVDWRPLDSLYGSAEYWQELRYVLPGSEELYLRFRYVSDGSSNGLGFFLDDLKVQAFGQSRIAAEAIKDTTCYLFNVPRDEYSYFVTAADSFGNVSIASQFYPSGSPIQIETWAEPYTRPAPFAGPCELWVDFPEGETPDVAIYTLSGTLVRKFEDVTDRFLEWDGRNEAGSELADGVYLVVVTGSGFRKTGKVARVTRGGE